LQRRTEPVCASAPEHPEEARAECARCGTCCVAPDISALDKPLGVRCQHLGPDLLCALYERRPEICRAHRPDSICRAVSAPTLEERVAKYLALFGLEAEARQAARSGARSMRQARASGGGVRDGRR
jgi:Fe-S-cluster containining protein